MLLYFLPVELLVTSPDLSKWGQCLQFLLLHFLFFLLVELPNISVWTRMSCKPLGFLWPNTMSWSIKECVPELLRRIGHSSFIHSWTGGLVRLNSIIQERDLLSLLLSGFLELDRTSNWVHLFTLCNELLMYVDIQSLTECPMNSIHSVQFLLSLFCLIWIYYVITPQILMHQNLWCPVRIYSASSLQRNGP